MDEINLYLEEYKILKEEAKLYTDGNFKELQFIITVVALFVTVVSYSQNNYQGPFWWLVIVQFIVYLFLLILASRITYILSLRSHLAGLETKLKGKDNSKLQWESILVSDTLPKYLSLNYLIQLMIAIAYIISFVILALNSLIKVWEKRTCWTYLLFPLVIIEAI